MSLKYATWVPFQCSPILVLCILGGHDGTVRKRSDPAILDHEELFLQLEIEEIFFSEEFSDPNFKDHS